MGQPTHCTELGPGAAIVLKPTKSVKYSAAYTGRPTEADQPVKESRDYSESTEISSEYSSMRGSPALSISTLETREPLTCAPLTISISL